MDYKVNVWFMRVCLKLKNCNKYLNCVCICVSMMQQTLIEISESYLYFKNFQKYF